MDKKQELIDILDLQKDPEMALLKAIKEVGTKVDNSVLQLKNEISQVASSVIIPEQKEVDLTPIVDRIDSLDKKVNEPIIVKLQIV